MTPEQHLETAEVAAYVDRALAPADRARVEAHLVECAECRGEIVAVARLLRAPRRPGVRFLPVGVAAAAAAVLLFLWLRPPGGPLGSSGYREPAVTTTVAPAALGPRGLVPPAPRFVWTAVPHADRYRLTLFDASGDILWETRTADTSVALPDTIALHAGASYFWKVQARTDWNRWVASALVEFSLAARRP